MATVTKLDALPQIKRRKRVAAYVRVSGDKDSMMHSLSAQISYYNALIQRHIEWDFAGVYADDPVSGTKNNRIEFQRILTDCRAGKIDMIITKSITRFARNTLTTLKVWVATKLLLSSEKNKYQRPSVEFGQANGFGKFSAMKNTLVMLCYRNDL